MGSGVVLKCIILYVNKAEKYYQCSPFNSTVKKKKKKKINVVKLKPLKQFQSELNITIFGKAEFMAELFLLY